jgi:hypothetical protein
MKQFADIARPYTSFLICALRKTKLLEKTQTRAEITRADLPLYVPNKSTKISKATLPWNDQVVKSGASASAVDPFSSLSSTWYTTH